jgi:hypothetical protein
MLHKYLFALTLVFSLPSCMAADSEALLLKKASDNSFVVGRGDMKKRIVLDISIADWLVSCDRKYAVVWGQTIKELPIGATPYAKVYVVDMSDAVARDSFTTTRGPFEVEIDVTGTLGIVDEYLIELETGIVKFTELPREPSIQKESCPDFRGRRLSSACVGPPSNCER